jgi:benzoate/toluate 1,2-dioxygenase alpha subunit
MAFEGSVFMTPYTNEYLRSLVRDDRVHRSIYTDLQIFELEMKKIFSRVWIYVGHQSQTPNPGGFYCTWVARQQIVMTRDLDGKVHFALQPLRASRRQSTKRGMRQRAGVHLHVSRLVVPAQRGAVGCADAPRLSGYRGFVFASLSPVVKRYGEERTPTSCASSTSLTRPPRSSRAMTWRPSSA